MISRRRLLQAASIGLAGFGVIGRAGFVRAAAMSQEQFATELQRLERDSGGRLGVTLLDTGNRQARGPSDGRTVSDVQHLQGAGVERDSS